MRYENLSREELIAEIRQLELSNSELKSKESETWNMIKILISKISHEFKTPLNSIIGFTELLKLRTNDFKSIDYIGTISISSEHMLELIQDILDVTCSQFKPMELSYSFFDTKEVIENIIKSFKDVEVSYTLVNMSICADYVRFKQLVYNLLSNAVKFNKINPLIQIITYVEDDNFCFEISDNGEGISEEYFDKIFDIFLQVSKDNLKRQIGSGIGLSLCKSIVDAHKGNIYVESKVGVGSTFTFKIPIDKV